MLRGRCRLPAECASGDFVPDAPFPFIGERRRILAGQGRKVGERGREEFSRRAVYDWRRPMTAKTLPDPFLWLPSAAAVPFLDLAARELAADASSLVRLTAKLRKTLSSEQVHLVLEQIGLRRRAKDKFAAAQRMFFTPQKSSRLTRRPDSLAVGVLPISAAALRAISWA